MNLVEKESSLLMMKMTKEAAFNNNNSLSSAKEEDSAASIIQNSVFCSHCNLSFTQFHPLMRCSGCDLVWYCGAEHQQYDWARHKAFCKSIQAKKAQKRSFPQSEEEGDERFKKRNRSTNNDTNMIFQQESVLFQQSPSSSTSSTSQIVQSQPWQPNQTTDNFYQIKLVSNDEQAESSGTSLRHHKKSSPRKSESKSGNKSKVPKIDHSYNLPYNVSVEKHIQNCLRANPDTTKFEAYGSRVQDIADHVFDKLQEYGWCAIDEFLGESHARKILSEVSSLHEDGMFTPGPLIKKHQGSRATSEIRDDLILWHDNNTQEGQRSKAVNFFISMLDSVLAQTASKLTDVRVNGRSRAMMGVFPGGESRYVKHVDNATGDGRLITSVYYLNPDWKPEDGGTLRLYPKSANNSIDVAPKFDRLFLFWSDARNPHEVMPAHKDRFAITVWYFDEIEKQRALKRKQRKLQSNPLLKHYTAALQSDHSEEAYPGQSSLKSLIEAAQIYAQSQSVRMNRQSSSK